MKGLNILYDFLYSLQFLSYIMTRSAQTFRRAIMKPKYKLVLKARESTHEDFARITNEFDKYFFRYS